MSNLFKTDLRIDVKYDLKGSKYGRTTDKKNWFLN